MPLLLPTTGVEAGEQTTAAQQMICYTFQVHAIPILIDHHTRRKQMLNKLEHKTDVIRNFSPAWFASVMGTGILAVTSKFYSCYLPFLQTVAGVLWIFNLFLFFVLLVPWLLRWIMYRQNALADLRHPILAQFYATIAIGCLVLAGDFLAIGVDYLPFNVALEFAHWFWIVGAILTFAFGIGVPLIMFLSPHVEITHINPGWFIPPVGLIVIPIAGAKLIPYWPTGIQCPMLILNYIAWSSGFFLWVFLAAICFYRFICHPPLPTNMVATVWINLGPIGAGTMALLSLIKASSILKINGFAGAFYLFGLIFWGFGFWWLMIAILKTRHYMRYLELPYAMSWWGFTFPLGAYVGASYMIAQLFQCTTFKLYGFILYWLLFVLWSIVLITTSVRAYRGDLFVRPKPAPNVQQA